MATTKLSVSLSKSEKAAKKTAAAMRNMLNTCESNEDVKAVLMGLQQYSDVILQSGDMRGKRINGAADHTALAQARAICDIVTRGNIPTIAAK